MNKLKIYPPSSLNSPDLMPPFSEFGYRFLAEGDSWFTVGALNPLKNSNLLFEMRFAQTGCVINCATPGDTLRADFADTYDWDSMPDVAVPGDPQTVRDAVDYVFDRVKGN